MKLFRKGSLSVRFIDIRELFFRFVIRGSLSLGLLKRIVGITTFGSLRFHTVISITIRSSNFMNRFVFFYTFRGISEKMSQKSITTFNIS